MIKEDWKDTLKTVGKSALQRAAYGTMAGVGDAFGVNTPGAKGRLSTRIIADELTNRWLAYLATQRQGGNNLEGNADDLRHFIGEYFGNETLAAMEPVIAQIAGPAANAQSQEPAAAQATPPVPDFLKKQRNAPPSPPSAASDDLSIPPVPSAPSGGAATQPQQTQQQQAQAQPVGTFGRGAPANRTGFGRKGTTAAPYVPPSELDRGTASRQPVGTFGRVAPVNTQSFGRKPQTASPERRNQFVSQVASALSKTQAGSPQRQQLLNQIRQWKANPRTVARFPELAQIRTESIQYKGSLLEVALKRSEIDQIFGRLAAYELKSGRAFTSTQQPQTGGGEQGNAHQQTGGPSRRIAPAHGHFDARSTLHRNVTLQGIENAQAIPVLRNFPVPANNINAVKKVIQDNGGSLAMDKLLQKLERSAVSPNLMAFLLYAAEQSR